VESIAEVLLDGTDLDLWSFLLLCGVSFIGSFTTAALGLGGGILVLATMSLFFPPAVLIPIHGVVQLGSNVGRAALMFRNVLREILPVFLIGTILGAVLGANLVVALPIALLQFVLALFILYSTWAPKFQASEPSKLTFFGVGAVGSFVTMFVGATGPLVMPFASAACKERQAVVATHATLMSIQHMLKLIAFGILGFAFAPFMPLLVGLIAFGFIGTFIGKHALNRLPEHVFRIALKTIVTVIAFRLLFDVASAAMP
jgi:uncharacterized membrane protein YfcA